jgi:Leucine-rich repeat (LRR) protein
MKPSSKKTDIQVIDDKLLVEGITVKKTESSSSAADRRELTLVDMCPIADILILSFRNLGKIENLVGLQSLVKLCLDNNQIKEIVNLDHLVNLKWLDLSFNNIEKIQGLKSLKQLEDLSLYSNNISIIEGLDSCVSLQCISLGNNKIKLLEQVIRLRQLRNLRMLTLSGNPICNEPEYKMTVLAYVDALSYLDYALVDSSEIANAKEQYHDELLDIEEKESVIAEKTSRDRLMSEYLHQLDEAGIIFAHILFDDMFSDDSDLEKLKHLPGTKELIEIFRVSFKTLSDEFIKNATEKYEKKKKESNDFEKSITLVRTRDDAESITLVDNFNKSKKNMLNEIRLEQQQQQNNNTDLMMTTSTTNTKYNLIQNLQQELIRVGDELLSIEIRQVEKFEVLIDEYDSRINELKNQCLEMQQFFFRGVEELEDRFSSNVRGVTTDLIDRLTKEELAEDYLDDEAMALVVDKDSCMQTLSGSHDLHIGKILKREDEARATETKRYQEMVLKYTTAEKARNRDRILQIHDFCKSASSSLTKLLALEEEDGYDDEPSVF